MSGTARPTPGELNHFNTTLRPLLRLAERPIESETTIDRSSALPMYWPDYLTLVDITGRQIASGKRGRIDASLRPILERLGFGQDEWISASTAFRHHFRNGDVRLKQSA